MEVKKAVIPVAGLGTRLLPATKSQPKEMLPVGRKPVIQYVVEEMEKAGLNQILFITGRKKYSIEDHFDRDLELVQTLTQGGKSDLLEELDYEGVEISFFYIRQTSPLGLGDAVSLARNFVGNESFVVALGDTIIKDVNEGSLLTKMMEVHRQTQAKCTLAVEEVSEEEVYKYGVVTPGKGGSRGVFPIKDIIEKPKIEKAPSNLAVASRYVFEPEIFAALKKTLPDHRGEIQLTDAIKILLTQGYLVEAVKLEEGQVRYDIGTHESYFRAFIDFALADKKYGYTVRQYLTKKLASF